jgi:hypothetical protein
MANWPAEQAQAHGGRAAVAPFAPLPFAQAPFDQLQAFEALLAGADFPSIDLLDAALAASAPPRALRFVRQDQALFRDRLHFEQRIAELGAIAVRPSNWHDLFNALMWLRHPRLKLALNALQVADLATQGRGNRTRRQQALTHVDEAGVLVACEDTGLFAALDAHDWHELFVERRAQWGRQVVVHVFGHALFDLMRAPHQTLSGKALLFSAPAGFCALPFADRARVLDAAAAAAVFAGLLGADPAAMPSLPLSGIPGWRAGNDDPLFVRTAECFRPRPEGRVYSAPVALELDVGSS